MSESQTESSDGPLCFCNFDDFCSLDCPLLKGFVKVLKTPLLHFWLQKTSKKSWHQYMNFGAKSSKYRTYCHLPIPLMENQDITRRWMFLRRLPGFEGYYWFFTLLIILMMFEAYTSIKYCLKMSLRFLFVKFAFACHIYVHIPKFLIGDKINNCVSIPLKQTLYCK